MLKLFDSKVSPILTYGAEIWGVTGGKEMELVANKFYKTVLGLRKNASVVFTQGELGRQTMESLIEIKIIKYWLKLIRCNNDRAVKKCYDYQKHLADRGNESWGSKVKGLLFSYGFGEVWMCQEVGDENAFLSRFKQRVSDISYQDWHSKVNSYGPLRTYKSFKWDLKIEWYATIDLSRKVLNTIARLRGGLLRIAINEGRWNRIPLEDRLCTICNLGEIENEFHIIFLCPAYVSFRNRLFTMHPVFRQKNFHTIFNVRDVKLLKDLCSYIDTVMDFRADILDIL